MSESGLYIGLMSGTSVDAIDAVLVDFSGDQPSLAGTYTHDIDVALRERIFSVSRGEKDRIHDLCTLDLAVASAFSEAALALLERAGVEAADVRAIGSHGQTIRHHPNGKEGERYTLQIGDANTIAERTGICTATDFRRRDMAAGGEGAPLVPRFHGAVFGASGEQRAIVNIGGIANATLLDGQDVKGGFDCGPGNTLLDNWINRQKGERFDAHGAWAAEHEVDSILLRALLDDEFFKRRGPRSTGPEHFNLRWLEPYLTPQTKSGDVQATLAEVTATGIADSLLSGGVTLDAVYVCGGGARNTDLMRRLNRRLEPEGISLGTTDDLGLDAEWVEASAFAWLAMRTLSGLTGNSPAVTGAAGERVLGAVYAGATETTQV